MVAHPVVSSILEGYIIENIMYMLPSKTPVNFYRSNNGSEIDLILNLLDNLRKEAIKVKRSFFPLILINNFIML